MLASCRSETGVTRFDRPWVASQTLAMKSGGKKGTWPRIRFLMIGATASLSAAAGRREGKSEKAEKVFGE